MSHISLTQDPLDLMLNSLLIFIVNRQMYNRLRNEPNYNIGNNNPVKLMDFITAIENRLGKKISKNMMPIQPGDVPATFADVKDLVEDLGYKPETPIQDGVNQFVDWYLEFFGYDSKGSK